MRVLTALLISIFIVPRLYADDSIRIYEGRFDQLLNNFNIPSGTWVVYDLNNKSKIKVMAVCSAEKIIHLLFDEDGDTLYKDILHRNYDLIEKKYFENCILTYEFTTLEKRYEKNGPEKYYNSAGELIKFCFWKNDTTIAIDSLLLMLDDLNIWYRPFFNKNILMYNFIDSLDGKIFELYHDRPTFERYENGNIKAISSYTDKSESTSIRINFAEDGSMEGIENYNQDLIKSEED